MGHYDDITMTDENTPCEYAEYTDGDELEAGAEYGQSVDSELERKVWDALYQVDDPEMPISIVDLGLIYGITVSNKQIVIDLTFTYSGCPGRQYIIEDIEREVQKEVGMKPEMNIVYDPPWTLAMVSETGVEKLEDFGISVPNHE